MTLTEFLLARVAEDEAVARECAKVYPPPWDVEDRGATAHVVSDAPHFLNVTELDQAQAPDVEWLGIALDHIARHDPARVLAECEAKRDAIRAAWVDHCQIDNEWGAGSGQARLSADNDNPAVVEYLASPYSDHPDYRPEWKP